MTPTDAGTNMGRATVCRTDFREEKGEEGGRKEDVLLSQGEELGFRHNV